MVVMLATSCTVARRYPPNKPFVFRTDINIKGNLPRTSRQLLRTGLNNQLDDSLRVRTVLAVRIVPPFFYNRLSRPPVFDTAAVSRSKMFMTALLNAQGFFNPTITDTFKIDTVRDQMRVTTSFVVTPGTLHRFDSIRFALNTPELQQLALDNASKSFLKRNDPYSLANVSAELDRLINIFRNNGFFRITKMDLFAEHDTVVAALIDPTLDPFEQFRLLDSLHRLRDRPTINITIRQRVPSDSSHIQKFFIGNVDVYPTLSISPDSSTSIRTREALIDGFRFHYSSNEFKLPFIARNILLRKGELYRVDNYFRTINTFTTLGAWQQVNIDLTERPDSSHILDTRIQLFPARRQTLNIDFETSRNTSDVLTTGALFGTGFNVGITNRNAFRESISTATNLRFGVELGTNFIQTAQTSISHTVYIPRFIAPFNILKDKNVQFPRTLFNINAAYTDRRDFIQVRSVNTSWGYEWTKKNHTWQYTPLNIELTKVYPTDSFDRVAAKNPSLRFAFNDGFIVSQILSYISIKTFSNGSANFRTRIEESGALLGLFRNLDRGSLKRFIKGEVEYRYFLNRKKSTWAFRALGGYGYAYGLEGNSREQTLPFFKAYFAGGPYTMRGWRVRQLGPGSNKLNDTLQGGPFDRFGDIKLEGNVEYRFDLGRIFGIKVKSAFFTDFGNIWARNDLGDPTLEGSDFRFNRLYKDLAVAGGTSLRFDFDFFLIRFDWAYKLKNPLYAETNYGWFQNLKITDGQFQLGIGYPF
jgi:outer membrane protein insertion porin family